MLSYSHTFWGHTPHVFKWFSKCRCTVYIYIRIRAMGWGGTGRPLSPPYVFGCFLVGKNK
nr:MAG TPA: hypothetical protein [Caudoviricetes sp.]